MNLKETCLISFVLYTFSWDGVEILKVLGKTFVQLFVLLLVKKSFILVHIKPLLVTMLLEGRVLMGAKINMTIYTIHNIGELA